MGETTDGTEIRIWCCVSDSKQYLKKREHDKTTNLKVYLPSSPLGINVKLKLNNGFHVQLQKNLSACNSYLLKFQKDVDKKEFFQLECRVQAREKCHVILTKCKVRNIAKLQIVADKISTKSIFCNGALSLEGKQTIFVQSSIKCPVLSLNSRLGDVLLSTECSISTCSLSIFARKLKVEGSISGFQFSRGLTTRKKESRDSKLLIRIRGDLHIARDGRIGTNDKSDGITNTLVEKLILDVKGDITNFGKVLTSKILSIKARNIFACRDCKEDTAERYQKINEERLCGSSDKTKYCPETTDLYNAIASGNFVDTAALLKLGMDPGFCSNTQTLSPSRKVELDLKKCFTASNMTSTKKTQEIEKVDGAASLTRAWLNRFGIFIAPKVHCQLSGDIHNLSQFSGLDVTLYINGNITIEEGSKCTLGNLSGKCNGSFNIEGDAVIGKFIYFDAYKFAVAKNAIMVIENGGNVNVNDTFINSHIVWNCSGDFKITTGVFQQKKDCKLHSEAALFIVINQDSYIIEGEISACSLNLSINAHVVENCYIKSGTTVNIEILEGYFANRINHFCHKGCMEILNGSLVVRRSNYAWNWIHEDVTFDGLVTSRGIRALSSTIMMTSKSSTTILPDKRQADTIHNSIITFEVGCLHTSTKSYVYFSPEVQIQNIRIHCQNMWRHYGSFEIKTSTIIENVVEICVWKFANHGYFKGFDILSIKVNAEMSSWKTLISRRDMTLTGIGNIYNQSGAILRCTNGCLNIHNIGRLHNVQGARIEGMTVFITTHNAKNEQCLRHFDMKNAGIIFATSDIYVASENIFNRGIIHSETSRIELVFRKNFSKATKLEGQVVAPMQIFIEIMKSHCFHFKCVGGKDCVEEIFHVPTSGLILKCRNGVTIIKRKIVGQSLLEITSPLGVSILKDIIIQKLFIKFRGTFAKETNIGDKHMNDHVNKLTKQDTVNNEKQHSNQRNEEKRLLEIEREIALSCTKPTYTFLYIFQNSKLNAHELYLNADIQSLRTRMQTFSNSMISIESDVYANNDLIIDGVLNLSTASKIEAHRINLTENNICTIKANERNADTKIFRIIADQGINLAGHISAEKGEVFPSKFKTRHGDITLSGKIELDDVLVLKSGNERNISFEGNVCIVGPILIGKADNINAGKYSFLQCEAFAFKATSRNSSVTLNGRTYIKGPMYLQNVSNLTITGSLTTEGISASTAKMYLAQSSVTSIKSSRNKVNFGDHDVIHCCLDSLHTDTNSIIRLVHDKQTKAEAKLKMDVWIHRGLLEMKYDFPLSSELYIQIQKFVNKGHHKNIDCCFLECNEYFDNFKIFAVKKVLTIVGSGKVHNQPGSNLLCQHGEILVNDIRELQNDNDATIACNCLSINAKMKLMNDGTMSCQNEMNIKVASVHNKGVIESVTMAVTIYWLNDKLKKSCISGRIKSPKEIRFIANRTKEFSLNCTGGKSDSLEEFSLPSCGLIIVCRNGYVVLNSRINNDLKCSSLNVCSLNRCEITESVTTHTFNLEGNSEPSENMTKARSVHINKKGIHTQNIFTLAVLSGGKLSVGTLVATMDNKISTYVMETQLSSSISCYRSLHTNSDFFLKGKLHLNTSCSVYAPRLKFSPSSRCIIETLSDSHANDNEQKCSKIFAQKSINLEGELSGCDGSIIIIRSEQEDISIKGQTNCSDLSIVSQNKNVCFGGVVLIDGIMEIIGAKEIEVLKGSTIKCKALSCGHNETIKTRTELFSIHGMIEVHGSMICTADTFILKDDGTLSTHSTNESDQIYINTKIAVMSGNFICNIVGNCIFDSQNSVLLENGFNCVLAANECIFAAKSIVEMKEYGRIGIKRGRLLLINEIEGTVEEINGKICFRGAIFGANDNTNISCETYMLIEGRDIDIQNLEATNIATIDIQAAFTLLIDENTHIQNGLLLEINAMTFDFKGEISKYTDMHLEVSNMLVLGKIYDINEIVIKADLAAVNSGQISGLKTGIVAPIYLSCPQGFNGCQVTSVAELGSKNQKELIVEGLLCILVGSYIQGTRITLKSVLQFEFTTKASTIPELTDLDRWKTVVDLSLSKISSQLDNQPAINKLVEEAMRIPEVICKLGVASHLCSDIIGMTEKICKGGLSAFRVDDLVTSLNKAHSEYSRISPLSLKINLNVRAKFKKIREPIKKVAMNLIKKIFGPDSFSTTCEFGSKNEDKGQGIEVVSFVYDGERTDKKTDGTYFALSLVLDGKLGSWKNGGFLETCGDVIISSGIIKQRCGKGRLLKAIAGSIKLYGTEVDLHNTNSETLMVSAEKTTNLENIRVSQNAEIEAASVNAIDMEADSLNIHATEKVDIQKIDVDKKLLVKAKHTSIIDIKAEDLKIKAIEKAHIERADVSEKIKVKTKYVDIKNSKARDVVIKTEEQADIERVDVSNRLKIKTKYADIKNSKAEDVVIKAEEKADIENVDVSNRLKVKTKYADIKNSKAEDVVIKVEEKADIENVDVSNKLKVKTKYADIKNSKAEDVVIKAEEKADIENVDVSNRLKVKTKYADIKNSKAEDVVIKAEEKADIENVDVSNRLKVSTTHVNIKDSNAENVFIEASKNVNISGLQVDSLLDVDAISADLTDTKAKVISVKTTQNTNVGNVKADCLLASSENGDISFNSKVVANNAVLHAKHGQVSLSGSSKKANHTFGSLTMHTKHLENIEKLLDNEDVYNDLKISDHLGLFVEDQDVILARSHTLEYSLALHAATIKVEGSIDAKKTLKMISTKGDFVVGRQINIKCKGDVLFKAKQNLTQNFGSSVSSGRNLFLEAEDGSVDIIGSKTHAEKSVDIKAKWDINIKSIQNIGAPSTRSAVTSGSGDDEIPAIILQAERNININASDVKSRGCNIFKAENNINITTNRYETVKQKQEKSWFGLIKKTTKTTTTNVESSNIYGDSNCFIAKGDFMSIASKIKSEMGTDIHADGTVYLLDEVTTEKVEKSSRFFGLFNSSQKTTLSEKSVGTQLVDHSTKAQSSVTSTNSDIQWNGSSLKTRGDLIELAKNGTVRHSRRILNKIEKERKIGFYAFKSSNPNEKGNNLKFGFQTFWAEGNCESTSNDKVEVGGNYIVTSNKFWASSDIHIDKHMTLDARAVTFKGTTLQSDDSELHFGVGINKTAANFNFSKGKGTNTLNKAQNLYTGGKLLMTKVDNATFDNAKVDAGSLEGNIKNMNVISIGDTETNNKLGLSLEYDLVTKTPGIGLLYEGRKSEKVDNRTTVNIRSSSQGLSVGQLTMQGAHMAFDGNVHNFANNIVNKDVHETLNALKFGLNISIPKSVEQASKSIQIGINHSSGRTISTISSKNGTIDSAVSSKVNTNHKKCRNVDRKFGFNFTTEFKDISETSRQLLNTGKEELVNTTKKELVKTCKTQFSNATGINPNVVDKMDNVADTIQNLKGNMDNVPFPSNLKHLQLLQKNISSRNMLHDKPTVNAINRIKDIVRGKVPIEKEKLLKICKEQFKKATNVDPKTIESITMDNVVDLLDSKIDDNSITTNVQSLIETILKGNVLESVKKMHPITDLK